MLTRYFITTSKDMTARLYTLHPVEGFQPKKFGGHRDVVIAAFFSEDEKTVSLRYPPTAPPADP
jgi:periodic tryptophan protein 2